MMNRPFTRNELINILRGWYKSFQRFGKSHERNVQALAEAADMLEHGKWISVKDGLPESTDLYLVNAVHRYNKADGDRSIQVRLYFKDDDEWHGLPDLYEITHWMPLPKAPKEESK